MRVSPVCGILSEKRADKEREGLHRTVATQHVTVALGTHGTGVAPTELRMYLHEFLPAEDIVVVHIIHIHTFTFAVAEAERLLHYLHTLIHSGVLYEQTLSFHNYFCLSGAKLLIFFGFCLPLHHN